MGQCRNIYISALQSIYVGVCTASGLFGSGCHVGHAPLMSTEMGSRLR